MKQEKKTIEQLQVRYREIQSELRGINDAAEAAGRTELNADEEKRFNDLTAEGAAVKRQIRVAAMAEDADLSEESLRAASTLAQEYRLTTSRAKAAAELRKAFTTGARSTSVELALRAGGLTVAADVAGAIPVTIGDVIQPLEKGLIMGKVGTKILTGLSGDYKYPVIPYVEAKIEDENVKVEGSDFPIENLTPHPKRLSMVVPLSNWAVNQSDMVLYNEVVKAVVVALQRTLNRWFFQPSAIVSNVFGPLAYNAAKNAIHVKEMTTANAFADIQSLIGMVESTGAYNDGTSAFVMSAKMAAKLRATPIAPGSDKMILDEKNMISGFPVYFTEFIESTGEGAFNADAKNIGFGRWSDAQCGQFGNINLLINPYKRDDENITVITINAHYSVDTLRPGSFALGTFTA